MTTDLIAQLTPHVITSCLRVYATEERAGRPVPSPREKVVKLCRVCGRKAKSSGLCQNCQRRKRLYGDPTLRMRGERGKGRQPKGTINA
jgi:hypothetical protein